ncbi:phosphoglycerate kinase [Roseibacterium sp. SDUM158016]|uniref:phosphoglycerate kinase n=1 Tax=Roseicyclus sediminis TaxID=2980997 RepID=UPI0021D1EEE6|nr:phosphoglycerate kinase [Roseibacterium sp. SDUM158016]MCU4654775.1 phosphoglycerate kinase [Roseibacterium sp. SDUM158016]
MTWKTLDDLDLAGRIVLTRVDINVPVEDGRVTDATRIERIVPTVKDILAKGGRPVLLAHFGRPKGKVVPEMSLRQVVPALEAALGQPVAFLEAPDRAALEALPAGSVALLENTRFDPGEEKNDPDLARSYAALGDVYCNDAFSAAHRAHATTEGLAHLLPCCAGRLMEAELKALEAALGNPERPVLAVVGGAKVSTKLDLLGNLVEKVDMLVIGGGMANTFLAAEGVDVAKSLCEHDLGETARDILARARAAGCEVILPTDVVVAEQFAANADNTTVAVTAVPADTMILDAGPQSVARVRDAIDRARTLIWNGPLGAFEIEPFDAATNAAATHAAERSAEGALVSVAGGGDTVAALNRAGAAEKFSYISTAGGAFLEWMEGKTLPGVAALEQG